MICNQAEPFRFGLVRLSNVAITRRILIRAVDLNQRIQNVKADPQWPASERHWDDQSDFR